MALGLRNGQLTFKATRQLDAALVEGSVTAESAEIEVGVSRPLMVRARIVSTAGVRRFYADGQHISLLDEGMKLYATVPLAGTIDGRCPRRAVRVHCTAGRIRPERSVSEIQ